jgi:hypothetical protein
MTICEICGRSPAAEIKLKRNVGLVVAHRQYEAKAVLCFSCADKATREFQRETLVKGWTSPSSALSNPATLVSNAFRKKRHERKLKDQASYRSISSNPVPLSLNGLSASDLLLGLAETSGSEKLIVQEMILDFQGGGLTSNARCVSAISKPPTPAIQQEIEEIADSVIEGIQAAGGVSELEAFVFGVLNTGLWDVLGFTGDSITGQHQAITEATFTAARTLIHAHKLSEARSVLILGQNVYVNLLDWLAAKE